MRSPSGMTYDKFESLYRNFSTTIESYDNSDQTWERRYNNIELYSDLKNL